MRFNGKLFIFRLSGRRWRSPCITRRPCSLHLPAPGAWDLHPSKWLGDLRTLDTTLSSRSWTAALRNLGSLVRPLEDQIGCCSASTWCAVGLQPASLLSHLQHGAGGNVPAAAGTASLGGKEAGDRCRGWQGSPGEDMHSGGLSVYYPGSTASTCGTLCRWFHLANPSFPPLYPECPSDTPA